jgi:hypothetical protein
MLFKKLLKQLLILVLSGNYALLISSDQLIVNRCDFVQSSEKQLFKHHKTSYLDKDHVRRVFFKIRINARYDYKDRDLNQAGEFLGGLFLSKPFFFRNDTQKKFILPREVVEKIIDYVDFKINPIVCEWIKEPEKMWNDSVAGIIFWADSPNFHKTSGKLRTGFFLEGQLSNEKIVTERIKTQEEIEKGKAKNKHNPIVRFSSKYEVYPGSMSFGSERFELVKPKFHPETRFENARWQFLPQWFSYENNKAFCVFMDKDFVSCFQNEDGYLVEKRRFDPSYREFSLLFVSPDWRTVCLVFPDQLDTFLSCQGKEKKAFVRLSYDDSNWLSKRIGKSPKKLTFWILIKRLLYPCLRFTKTCVSSILLILRNILSSK